MSDVLSEALKKRQLSVTKARQSVFLSLKSADTPITIREIISNCPTINRASVYRTVDLFEKHGLIRRLTRGWKYTLELSDEFTDHHHHITCQSCGMITDIADNSLLTSSINDVAQAHGFRQTTHELEIVGICINCQ